MSLPPERISVKRRRQEDPVDALYLQEFSSNTQKRRFTDYYFTLLRDTAAPPAFPKRVHSQIAQPSVSSPASKSIGIPTVRATAPGDEVDDFKRLIAAQKARQEDGTLAETKIEGLDKTKSTAESSAPSSPSKMNFQHARRFHLTRTLSSIHHPDLSGGIRKPSTKLRPPVPTFIERQSAALAGRELHSKSPIDRILNAAPTKAAPTGHAEPPLEHGLAKAMNSEVEVTAFVKPVQPTKKLGTSINDHPSTWDLESDQLADELSRLAMEMDADSRMESSNIPRPVVSKQVTSVDSDVDMADEFVYETYVRVSRDGPELIESPLTNVGVLVIDDEDEKLWQTYMEDEEEAEWDDEDSNAEENPANDYPEEEVSSDDEFGRGSYNYRQNGSDDEEYGDDYDSN